MSELIQTVLLLSEARNETLNVCGFLNILYDLRQEPRPSFALVDPNLDQTGGRDIVMAVANLMGGSQNTRQLLVVIAQFADHLLWPHVFFVIVLQPLVLRDIADRTIVVPPILRARSAIVSVMAKI